MADVNTDAIIEMTDEDSNTLRFEHLLTFEYDGEFFIAFTPIEKMDDYDVGEVLIMRIAEDDDDTEVYIPIESQDELDELWGVFQELYYDEEGEENSD